jgi:hypothetical protein
MSTELKPWRRTPYVENVAPLTENALMHVAADAVEEVHRQDALARQGRFGGTHILPSGPHEWRQSVLVEEVGEIARELNEGVMRPEGVDVGKLRKELIQTAACAIAWAASLDEGR